MQNSELKEIELLRQGNGRAQKALYHTHAPHLYAVCCRYLSNGDDAKDALQETFINIFMNVGNFEYRGKGTFVGWMKRICINECLKAIRKNSAVSFVDEELADVYFSDEDVGVEEIPPEELHRMIGNLPPGYRAVLNMYAFEQYSHKEIAEQLGISSGTSMSQLSRAKVMLKSMIMDYKKKN